MSLLTRCLDFGAELIRTEDLDPVYCAIDRAILNRPTLCKLLLAYWCFYHLGVSARIAEEKTPKAYWGRMIEAAVNEGLKWPRGSERRHFRGAQGINAVKELAAEGSALAWIDRWFEEEPDLNFETVASRVKQARGFGPWIAFKVADMGERVLGYPVDFSECNLGFYSEPRAGAALVASDGQSKEITDGTLSQTIETVRQGLIQRGFKTAPPGHDRPLNVQEVETVLCKFKSHLGGHYPPGKDIQEVSHGLEGWGDLAQELAKCAPRL